MVLSRFKVNGGVTEIAQRNTAPVSQLEASAQDEIILDGFCALADLSYAQASLKRYPIVPAQVPIHAFRITVRRYGLRAVLRAMRPDVIAVVDHDTSHPRTSSNLPLAAVAEHCLKRNNIRPVSAGI